jgi:bis(5'-nucleosidyl)-tetraphosphatase
MAFFSFEKSVGGVVFRKQDRKILFLLLRYRSWQWDFPKGHREKGESEEQTLRREILEETGISNISILPKFRKSAHYFYRARGNEKKERLETGRGINIFKKAVYYVVETPVKKVKIDFENKDFAWLSFDEAHRKLGNNDSRRILTLAKLAILSENE